MVEQGKVIKTIDDIAEVEMTSTSNCHKCQACLFLSPDKRVLKVQNKLSAKEGDSVRVLIYENRIVSGLLLYILPLISFFLFLILSNILFHIKEEPIMVLFGFFGMILIYFFIRIFSNTKELKNCITEIIYPKTTD